MIVDQHMLKEDIEETDYYPIKSFFTFWLLYLSSYLTQSLSLILDLFLKYLSPQDCSLPFSQSVACGLQDKNISWSQFNKIKKPVCGYGDIQGTKIKCMRIYTERMF